MKPISLFLCLLLAGLGVQAQGPTFFVDFGKNDGTNGDTTASPDVNGTHWNNVLDNAGSGPALDLVDSAGQATTVQLQVNGGFTSNGILNGGLLAPDPALLGDFAIATATHDYFFIFGTQVGSFTVSGLIPGNGYLFSMFGTRQSAENRISQYDIIGANTYTDSLQTSGSAIGNGGYNGNNDNILVSDTVFADANGEIRFELSLAASSVGSFAYLGVMKMEELAAIPVNLPPTVDAGADVILPAGSSMASLMGSATDPDGDPLTYSWTQVAGPSASIDAPSSANTDVSGLMDGNSYAFALTASDGNASSTDTVMVLVRNPREPGVRRSFLVDLGKDDVTNGNPTLSPDVYGNHWNNLLDPSANGAPIFLVDMNNQPSGIELQTTSSLLANGIQNGGLLEPEDSLLGELAVPTATQDYFFTVGQGSLTIDDLDPSLSYRFSLFASRNTDMVRQTGYVLTGANSYSDTLQSSGPDLGGNGYDGNNRNLLVTPLIQPNAEGQIEIEIIAAEGGFGYLNMMRIDEIDDAPRYLVDFGLNDGANGNETLSPDVNGQYWNNVIDPLGSTSDTVFLVDNANRSNGAYVKVTGTFGANGIQNGGLLDPDPALLGDLAIPTATQDYFFTGGQASITFGGLDVEKGYLFQVFGTRNTTITRITGYTFTGNNSSNDSLQTSGPDIGGMGYNGNTMNLAVSDTIYPNGAGIITLDVASVVDLAYIGMVSIREVTPLVIPTPDPIIAVMGSSVADGFGAANSEGYAFRYTELLEARADAGEGGEYNVINISVGGNTTVDVLNRWESDLQPLNAQYVMYGLSLANEGISGQGQAAFDQFRDNMLILIDQARQEGIEPVVVNCYANGSFGATQYQFTKDMNLLIHEWDVASVNVLGAIDDGEGRWVSNYQSDPGHPNTAGHREMSYSIVPSLFDALEAGKARPERAADTYLSLDKSVVDEQIVFQPDAEVHSFTMSFDIRTTESGSIGGFTTDGGGYGGLQLNGNGQIAYLSSENDGIQTTTSINDGNWHTVTLTHYYARGRTFLYVDGQPLGSVAEQVLLDQVILSEQNGPTADYRDWFFYRAGMTEQEIDSLVAGAMLQSSLALYAPLDGQGTLGTDELVNLAQSTNTVSLEPGSDFITSIQTAGPAGLVWQVYPNPTQGAATFRFALTQAAAVRLSIYDQMGKEVATVLRETLMAGAQQVEWTPAVGTSAGLYLCVLEVNGHSYTEKLLIQP